MSTPQLGGDETLVAASRSLTGSDNGQVLEVTTTCTLTVPAGGANNVNSLPVGFGCTVIPGTGVTVSVAVSGTATLNGAVTTLTRTQASNTMFALVQKKSTVTDYAVTGS